MPFDDKLIEIDDEIYFTLSHSEMKVNDGFYTGNIESKDKSVFKDITLVYFTIFEAWFISQSHEEHPTLFQKCPYKLLQFLNANNNYTLV